MGIIAVNTLVCAASMLVAATVTGFGQSAGGAPSPDVLKDLAPTGKLRAAINLGNSVLAQSDAARAPFVGAKPIGKRPAWAEFALQEALRVTEEDSPSDLAARHDDYASGLHRKP